MVFMYYHNKHVCSYVYITINYIIIRYAMKKMATKFYTQQHTLKYTLFEKSRLKCTSNTINNIALL